MTMLPDPDSSPSTHACNHLTCDGDESVRLVSNCLRSLDKNSLRSLSLSIVFEEGEVDFREHA